MQIFEILLVRAEMLNDKIARRSNQNRKLPLLSFDIKNVAIASSKDKIVSGQQYSYFNSNQKILLVMQLHEFTSKEIFMEPITHVNIQTTIFLFHRPGTFV